MMVLLRIFFFNFTLAQNQHVFNRHFCCFNVCLGINIQQTVFQDTG